jgi:hypothetical protein
LTGLNSFFPLDRVTSETDVPGRPDVTFGQVIPAVPLGELPDDAEGFSVEPDGRFAFLVIKKGHNGEAILQLNGDGTPFVQPADDPNHPTLLEIVKELSSARASPEQGEEPVVPWRSFVTACYLAMDRDSVLEPRMDPGSQRTYEMVQFLKELNGAVPSWYDTFVFRMTLYDYQVGGKTGFKDKIRDVHKALVGKFHPKAESQ